MYQEIINFFQGLDPILGALIATLFTWALTAFGASFVFLFKSMNRVVLDGMLGFTGGVMVAASFWSLLAPGIEMSEGEGFIKVIPAAVGFALGALFIFGLDKVLPHIHINFKESEKFGEVNFHAQYQVGWYGACCNHLISNKFLKKLSQSTRKCI